ncbi:hypothetical protein HOF92_13220 [bacterium]|nr:hypothetical protein [bacterium]
MDYQNELNETLGYLASDEAFRAIDNDPYWPKWDTPWWRIMTLYEMGMVHLVPERILNHLVEKVDSHYIKTFPLVEKDIPSGVDPYRQIPCHCALGTLYQALSAYGIAVDKRLPWLRPWFLEYQLPDGGLNCDEQAYTKSKKSSIVSSLPPLEAILYFSPNGLTPEEEGFVDKGAHYLIKHRLIYKSSSDDLMDESFLRLCSPRFYEYDFLRGLIYLVNWQKRRHSNESKEVIEKGCHLLRQKLRDDSIVNERISFDERETLTKLESGAWEWLPSQLFPLLEKVGETGIASRQLKAGHDMAINYIFNS